MIISFRQLSKTANEISASSITTMTHSGYTGFQLSSWRPHCNILVFTSNKRILCRLSLLWGVKSFYYNKEASTDKTIEHINKILTKNGYAKKGDMVINLYSTKDIVVLIIHSYKSCTFT